MLAQKILRLDRDDPLTELHLPKKSSKIPKIVEAKNDVKVTKVLKIAKTGQR